MPRLTQDFSSAAIARAFYDTETQELEIVFTSGRGYTYNNVPENIWESLCSARSAGSYFASNIKDRY